jgi:hypothetical protein
VEPVDPVDDYLTTRGTVRKVSLAVFVPATDSFAVALPIRGSRGEKHVTQGEVPITTCRWFITSTTPDVPLPRPTLKSLLVSQSESWRIDSLDVSPRNGKLFECHCTLVT